MAVLVSVSLECIVTTGSMARQRQMGGDNAVNLQPQRRECKGWSRIELRISDSRRLQKASIRGGKSLHAFLQMFINYSCIQPRSSSADLLPRLSEVWKLTKGSSNQVAARPFYSCSGLLLHPHFSPCSVSAPSHSLSFFYLMVTVSKTCLLSYEKAARDRCPFVKKTYFWNVDIGSCIETQGK